jgi:hypothetical protein
VRFTVESDLGGTIYFHWYVDGLYVGQTTSVTRTFAFRTGEMARVVCQDTNDADYDAIAGAPAGWPARRTLFWVRSQATDMDHYRVEQQRESEGWETIAIVHHDPATWAYRMDTPRLDDLTEYTWRIVPVDGAGNEGTALTIGPEDVVRAPDAPGFAITFDDGTDKVTYAAA